VQGKAVESQLETLADPEGGQFGASASPKPLCRPIQWRPFAINARLFGSHGSRNRFKNTSK